MCAPVFLTACCSQSMPKSQRSVEYSSRPRAETPGQSSSVASRQRRGVALAPTEKDSLIELCIKNRDSDSSSFQSQKKSFWIQISRLFFERTGRAYSWQSCRRCLTKWELEDPSRTASLQRPSTDSASTKSQDPENGNPALNTEELSDLIDGIHERFGNRNDSHEKSSSPSDINSLDDDLPQTPIRPMHRNIGYSGCHTAQPELRFRTCELISTTMDTLRSQLEAFPGVLTMDPEENVKIQDTFISLTSQINTVLRKNHHKDRR